MSNPLLLRGILLVALVVGCDSSTEPAAPVDDEYSPITAALPVSPRHMRKVYRRDLANRVVEFRWEPFVHPGSGNVDAVAEHEVSLWMYRDSSAVATARVTYGNTVFERAFAMPIAFDSTYAWRVVARSASGAVGTSATWWFVLGNSAPYEPTPVAPGQGATLDAGTVTLRWTSEGDADPEHHDAIVYDVILVRHEPYEARIVATRTAATSVDVEVEAGRTYGWYVVARDPAGATTVSEVQRFASR